MRHLIIILVVLAASVQGQTVDWSMNTVIDCPVELSTRERSVPVLLTFLDAPLSNPIKRVPNEFLEAVVTGNTLSIALFDPSKSDIIQAFDEKGRVFLIQVRIAKANEKVDKILIVRDQAAFESSGASGRRTTTADTDGHAMQMIRHMLGGASYVDIAGSLVSEVQNGKLVPGRVLFEDDTLTLTLMLVYQSSKLRGYHCLLVYRGEKPIRVNMQRLWFPGAICVSADQQLLADPNNPYVSIEPAKAIHLYYVGRLDSVPAQ